MADLVNYTVARPHQGDKITDEGTKVHKFKLGETRLADPNIVRPLVLSGVLIGPEGEGPLRTDGPTVGEFVAAGYRADNYPPRGYASRSTDEEIADAQRQQSTERQGDNGKVETKVEPKPETKPEPKAAAKPAPAAAPAKAKAEPKPAANKAEGNSTETKVEPPLQNKAG